MARRGRDGIRAARAMRYRLWLIRHALRHRATLAAGRAQPAATLSGAVTQDLLRNFVGWQLAIPDGVPLGVHGRLSVTADDAQLDRLLSLLCVSGAFDSVSLVFDRVTADAPLALGQPQPIPPGHRDASRLTRAFVPVGDARRTATNYLKIACPGAFVVAVSLVEDEDGFADDALAKWLPALRRFRRDAPAVAFCLVNRTMLLAQMLDEPAAPDIAPVRGLGFGLADALALTQMADAFIGRLDVFGLAALAADRPGVYVDPAAGERSDALGAQRFVLDPSPEECLELLGAIVGERRHGRAGPTRG